MSFLLKFFFHICILFGLVFSQTKSGASFLLIPVDARANSLGNAQVAKSDDLFASYWNPAGLIMQNKIGFGFVNFKLFPNLSNDMNYNYLGFVYPTEKYGTIGGHVIHLSLGKQTFMGETLESELGTFYSYMNASVLSYAYPINDKFSIGMNIRRIIQNISDVSSGNSLIDIKSKNISFDFSILIRNIYDKLHFGLIIKHLGDDIHFNQTINSHPQPQLITLGINYKLINIESHKIDVLYDLQNLIFDNVFVHCFGLEYVLLNRFDIRTGYYMNEVQNLSYFTIGSGLRLDNFGIDVSYLFSEETNPINNTMKLSILFNL